MSRIMLLLAMAMAMFVAVPLLVEANSAPFYIKGKVYCDNCGFGFETSATKYIHGAKVKIECRSSANLAPTFSITGITDESGTYNIRVDNDHQDQLCEASLVSSPIAQCQKPDARRSRASVIVTRDNGAVSDLHFANSMGFLQDKVSVGCAALHKLYFPDGNTRFI